MCARLELSVISCRRSPALPQGEGVRARGKQAEHAWSAINATRSNPTRSSGFCFYLQLRVCQRAALQARFRRRTSSFSYLELTLPCESTVSSPLPNLVPTFTPDIIVRL